MSVNCVHLVGRLGADPELRNTQAGTSVCNFRMATNRVWYDDQGNKQEETEWHSIVVWASQAEACSKYLEKGSQVYVEGRLQTRKWQDNDGNDRYSTEVVAQNVQFLSGGENGGGSRQGPPPPSDPPGGVSGGGSSSNPPGPPTDEGGAGEPDDPPFDDDDIPF